MALLTSTCTYAIRASLRIAEANCASGEFVPTRRIAEDLGVSFAFLTKVLLGLSHSGILASQRGQAGGVALARPARSITLHEIARSAGDDGVFRDCILGLPKCSDGAPCALHDAWRVQRAALELMFRTTTLGQLVETTRARSKRSRVGTVAGKQSGRSGTRRKA